MNALKPVGIAAAIIAGLALLPLVILLGLFIIKFVWSWVIPDLFPGAVEQGLIVRELSWYMAFKLSVFVGAMGFLARIFVNKDETK